MINQKANSVLVAGAGIVGVSTAIWLQRAGYAVTLLDREGPAAGTSYGNAGILAAAGVIPVTVPGLLKKTPGMLLDKRSPLFLRWAYLPKLLPFLRPYLQNCAEERVQEIARNLADLLHDTLIQHQQLAKDTPAAAFIKPCDYWYGYETQAAFEADQWAWNVRRENGYDVQVETGEAYGEFDPLYKGKFEVAVRLPNHGIITDPGAYVKALADHFVEQGGSLKIASVHDVEHDGAKVIGLKTNQGLITADHMVITLGAWSKPIARALGLDFPLESERGYHIELINPSHMPKTTTMITSAKAAVTPMKGRIRMAGIVEFAGIDAPENEKALALLKEHLDKLFPQLSYDRIETWMGRRPSLPNSVPAIGRVPGFDNLMIGVGHQHVGLTGGAKTGRILASMLEGQKSNLDLQLSDPALYKK